MIYRTGYSSIHNKLINEWFLSFLLYTDFFRFFYLSFFFFFPPFIITWPNYIFKKSCPLYALAHASVYVCIRVICVYMQVYTWWELTWSRTYMVACIYIYIYSPVYERVARNLFKIYYYYACIRICVCVCTRVCICVSTCQSIGTEEWTKTERNETIAKEGSR